MALRGSRRGHPTFFERAVGLLVAVFIGLPFLAIAWLFGHGVKAWVQLTKKGGW
jgi:hypothetical protein